MRKRIITCLLAATAAALVALPGAASAASGVDTVSATQTKQTPYCVNHLSQGRTTSCYSTFTAALSDGTNGKVTDAPASSAAVTPALERRINAVATKAGSPQAKVADAGGTVIGIDYWDVNYSKYSTIIEVSHGCDTDKRYSDWFLNQLQGGWDNQISSFKTFGNCQTFNYDGPNLTGPFVWSDNYDNPDLRYYNYPYGYDFNDRITSISWN